jgi:hypothetical protein
MCTTFFNIKNLSILYTDCIYVLRMILKINIDYYPEEY